MAMQLGNDLSEGDADEPTAARYSPEKPQKSRKCLLSFNKDPGPSPGPGCVDRQRAGEHGPAHRLGRQRPDHRLSRSRPRRHGGEGTAASPACCAAISLGDAAQGSPDDALRPRPRQEPGQFPAADAAVLPRARGRGLPGSHRDHPRRAAPQLRASSTPGRAGWRRRWRSAASAAATRSPSCWPNTPAMLEATTACR